MMPETTTETDNFDASRLRPGDQATYCGRPVRINSVSLYGICAPHYRLSYLDGDGGEGLTSHLLLSAPR